MGQYLQTRVAGIAQHVGQATKAPITIGVGAVRHLGLEALGVAVDQATVAVVFAAQMKGSWVVETESSGAFAQKLLEQPGLTVNLVMQFLLRTSRVESPIKMQGDLVTQAEQLVHDRKLAAFEQIVELAVRIHEEGRIQPFVLFGTAQGECPVQGIVAVVSPEDEALPPWDAAVAGRRVRREAKPKQTTICPDGEVLVPRCSVRRLVIRRYHGAISSLT
ncbi:MAG: hypothetical protein AW07_00883 [Candidatus Accumulibacter sp. SK-11]|nr:MAG: hypothetical protein AW07_00883 [Candidatus Accumulibacter sp. SK-11]